MSEAQPPLGPRSAALLAFLLRLPRFVLVLGVMAILLAGAFLPGIPGAVLVLAIAALLAWLARLAWRSASSGARAGRVVAVAVLLAFALTKF
ncbi:DUF6703 family protein [Cryptosporangium aurantiacum]|uniref:Uncharacterized protein n=1 Tax=Cryptosporangium aurantiacum TaxID=134849 RepID=A0A1M7Q5L9_9ACTN|nr:DUF6703 family protein [Cryptosporangium aurantiacum]SHN25508.1 hypothetical protein SAMN05443668_104170 [Cryptosporangium aurantiacum]